MTRRWRAGALTAVVLIGACSDAPTEPPGESLSLTIVSGDQQRTIPGWRLEETLIVKVTDSDGTPVSGVRVTFQVQAGSTSIPVASTGGGGLASVNWTLGSGATGEQTLTASIDGGVSVTFRATAVADDEADVIVVHGALDDLKGFVYYEQTIDGATVRGLQAHADTVIHVPPTSTARQVVVFGHGNRPVHVAPSWTPGVDTVHVDIQPPVEVDLEFVVKAGDFEARKRIMETQVQATQGVWRDEAMGIALRSVTFIDETDPPRDVDIASSSACSVTAPESVIRIDVVSSINSGQWTGWGCWVGQVYLGLGTDRFPNLLAHELGHTFTLIHTPTGMMFPNQPGTAVREGEIFRAHFHAQSALNRQFGSQPLTAQRQCHIFPSPCIPEGLDLDTGAITLMAHRGVFDHVFGPPVDENPPMGVGRHR